LLLIWGLRVFYRTVSQGTFHCRKCGGARQLTPDAREWFLAETVRVGMADGPLSDQERRVAEMIAVDLGMTQAQTVGVVTMAERAAQQN
jgi:hypothetical protein